MSAQIITFPTNRVFPIINPLYAFSLKDENAGREEKPSDLDNEYSDKEYKSTLR